MTCAQTTGSSLYERKIHSLSNNNT